MRHTLLALILLSGVSSPGQQPNGLTASLTINGSPGPPYPITDIQIFTGLATTFHLQGGAGAPFLVAATDALATDPVTGLPSGFPLLGGLIDLDGFGDPPRLTIVMDGFVAAPLAYSLDASGNSVIGIPVPGAVSSGLVGAFQGVCADPGASFGVTLTAATSVTTTLGIFTHTLATGLDGCVALDTQALYGFNIPFYATSYTSCQICANGFIQFSSGPNTDFTPSDPEMFSQPPKIAPFWTSLNQPLATSGPITAQIDLSTPSAPMVTFTWSNVASGWPFFSTLYPPLFHSFQARVNAATGDVCFTQPATNPARMDMMVGISPGLSLDPTGPASLNLNSILPGPYIGQANEGIYQGFNGAVSVTGTFPPTSTYNLGGQVLRFIAVSSGLTGASYILQAVPPGGC